jgi:YVTN family beta-propeller protein
VQQPLDTGDGSPPSGLGQRAVILGLVTAAVAALALGGVVVDQARSDDGPDGNAVVATPGAVDAAASGATPDPGPTTTPTAPPVPSSAKQLVREQEITGDISPKSVVASGTGLVFAQNMMYKHTVTVYGTDGALVKTIPDEVDLAAFGIPDHPGTAKGAPVEAAFAPDRKHAYVSNYSMYGAGFGPEGQDNCTASSPVDASFVYRINVKSLEIDAVIPVGEVPKALTVSPDGTKLLVSNWCSYDVSVIDTETNAELARVPLAAYPRGVVVDPTSTTAYVAVMGANEVATIDLASFAVGWIGGVGSAPRHLVMDPSGAFLYATTNGDGHVAKIDLQTGAVVARTATGQEPRTMDIAADGQSLYVVNYTSNTVSKLATDDLRVLQTVDTPSHPIGIAYEPGTSTVWVACYSGEILVYRDA